MISLVGNHSPLVGKPKPSAIAYGNGRGHADDHRLNAAPDALVWRPPTATAAGAGLWQALPRFGRSRGAANEGCGGNPQEPGREPARHDSGAATVGRRRRQVGKEAGR